MAYIHVLLAMKNYVVEYFFQTVFIIFIKVVYNILILILDTLLNCLGMDWELHRPFLQKSETITNLLEGADEPKPKLYYKSAASETLDNYIKKSNFYRYV